MQMNQSVSVKLIPTSSSLNIIAGGRKITADANADIVKLVINSVFRCFNIDIPRDKKGSIRCTNLKKRNLSSPYYLFFERAIVSV